ncbi:MAG: HNH endonuclease, partial [Actinomycetota bacterium]|nr:HNH endonuclease [Actinomycetota bacterium]
GKTKWNRTRFCVPKTHTLDALCVGDVTGVVSYPTQVTVARATGRGTYARTRPDSSGFPRLRFPRTKAVHGFRTGDLVRAVVPTGKYVGTLVGRVAVRSSGSFNISTNSGKVQGISYRHCTVLQRSDGWSWSNQPEGAPNAT